MVCLVVFSGAGAARTGCPVGDGGSVQWRNGGMEDSVRGRDDMRLGVDQLGRELGERATLVQFSSAFCAPCRATRRVLDEVAGMVPGVVHVEIDAEKHLDLVRALKVESTPTVLVLDAAGRVVRRAAGQPRRVDVIAALGEAVG